MAFSADFLAAEQALATFGHKGDTTLWAELRWMRKQENLAPGHFLRDLERVLLEGASPLGLGLSVRESKRASPLGISAGTWCRSCWRAPAPCRYRVRSASE
eukprot:scaffold55451_cov20-Tisochrysis_lutea.AAC.1